MYFCREYIHANLSFLDGEICVIDYYASRISIWVHDNMDINWEAETIESELWEDKNKMCNCVQRGIEVLAPKRMQQCTSIEYLVQWIELD